MQTTQGVIRFPDGHLESVKVAFQRWSETERRKRATKKTFKVLGAVFGISLLGLFIHVLLIVIIPTLILTVLVAFPLFLKFKGEEATFFHASGTCPNCGLQGEMRPYVNSRLVDPLTVQCAGCGQTARVHLSSPQPAVQG